MVFVYIQRDIAKAIKNLIQKTKNVLIKYIYVTILVGQSFFFQETMKLNFKAILSKVACRVQIW